MEINVRDLIYRLENFKKRKKLSYEDDFMLAIVIDILEQVAEKDEKGEW